MIDNLKLTTHYMTSAKVRKLDLEAVSTVVSWCGEDHNISTIFDLGANLGIYSLLFEQAYPSAQIYAFEPVKETYDLLKVHLEMNESHVKAYYVGFWSTPCTAKFGIKVDKKKHRHNTGRYSMFGDYRPQEVRLEVLDSWCEENDVWPDLIKIDVEGSEKEVIRGGHKAFSHARWLLCEERPEFDPVTLREIIRQHGFEPFDGGRIGKDAFWYKKHD
jgi:FkbM family methyltransferase